MQNYDTVMDEELIRRLRAGEKEIMNYLMNKYKNLVRREVKTLYLLGGERDDLIQEGMIGLFKAVEDYDLEKSVPFFSFAKLCITRQIYSAIEASKRKKHIPLNSYVSIYEESDGEEKGSVLDTLEAEEDSNPENVLLTQDYSRYLRSRLETCLSDMERQVFLLYLLGYDYKDIAQIMGKAPKTIDNALHRIRVKAGKIAEDEEEQ